ncbi:MAG: hypothetical protein II882_00505 [Lachnospiraceae bacterium]|nr:hypothetical protein [Lachnospiraceae bacterium]
MMTYLGKRILRCPALSLAGLAFACALCFVLCFLSGYRDSQERRLAEMRDSYEIRGVITDARGGRDDHLRLHKRYLEFIEDEDNGLGAYIKDVRMTKELTLTWDIPEEKAKGLAIGVNSPRAAKVLDPAWNGAYFCTENDFFESREYWCLIPEAYYADYAGKTIPVTLDNPYRKTEGTGSVNDSLRMDFELTVVGWVRGAGENIYIPFDTAQELGRRITDTISVDSISFLLKDNSQADLVREKGMEQFVTPDPSEMSFKPGLTIEDRQYLAAMTELQQNVQQTERLIPVSVFLSLAVGFLMGFLAVRGETKTYALMRTLGMGPVRLAGTVLLEQLLLPALGSLAVGLLTKQLQPALLYFGCHCIGCLLAVLRPALAAPTKLLRVQE